MNVSSPFRDVCQARGEESSGGLGRCGCQVWLLHLAGAQQSQEVKTWIHSLLLVLGGLALERAGELEGLTSGVRQGMSCLLLPPG